MGVGIRDNTDTVHVHIGSYSHLQFLRVKLVRATIRYLGHIRDELRKQATEAAREYRDADEIKERIETAERAAAWLDRWVVHERLWDGSPGYDRIEYGAVDSIPSAHGLSESGVIGVQWFVSHEDDGGIFSSGQCVDIAPWLKQVLAYIDNKDYQDVTRRIAEVFDYAVAHAGHVRLG
jgi:hypothetical protein